jgi:hypothetical protein
VASVKELNNNIKKRIMAFKMNRKAAFPKYTGKKSSGLPYKTKSPGLYKKPSMAKVAGVYEGDIIEEEYKIDKGELGEKVQDISTLTSDAAVITGQDLGTIGDIVTITEENITDAGSQGFQGGGIKNPALGQKYIKDPNSGKYTLISEEQASQIEGLTSMPSQISLTDDDEGADASTYLKNIGKTEGFDSERYKNLMDQFTKTGKITIDDPHHKTLSDPSGSSEILGLEHTVRPGKVSTTSDAYKSDISNILRGKYTRSGTPKKKAATKFLGGALGNPGGGGNMNPMMGAAGMFMKKRKKK